MRHWFLSFFRSHESGETVQGGIPLTRALLAKGYTVRKPVTPTLPDWARPNHELRKRELRGW